MAIQPQTGLTYQDLQAFPEDNLRREIIDGELIVTAAPATRHQRVVTKLVLRLGTCCEEHGGEVLPAPYDVYFSEANVVEPDVVYVREENRVRLEKKFLRAAPDLVVEVSSPTTRRLELVRKRELYERFGVPEYWFVDLDAGAELLRGQVFRGLQNPVPDFLRSLDARIDRIDHAHEHPLPRPDGVLDDLEHSGAVALAGELDVHVPNVHAEQVGKKLRVVDVGRVGGVLVASGAGVDPDQGPLLGSEALQHPVVQFHELPEEPLG